MASPERDIPCCAGTGPRSLRKDGFAGTGHTLLRRHRAALITKGWLRRNGTCLAAQAQGRVPYEKFRVFRSCPYAMRRRGARQLIIKILKMPITKPAITSTYGWASVKNNTTIPPMSINIGKSWNCAF